MGELNLRLPAKSLATVLISAAIVLGQGCASVKKGFAGTERAEFTPFAQKT